MPASIPIPELESTQLRDTLLIWEKARDAADSFLATFTDSRRARGSPRGTSTDAEQDMLRAALVFAGAGLDAVVKQLLTDAGEQLITPAFLASDDGEGFLKALARRIQARGVGTGEGQPRVDPAEALYLVRLLLSDSPRSDACRDLVAEVTAGSLQSVGELKRVCSLFGLDEREVITAREAGLRAALRVRNAVIHEMDIDLEAPNRRRRQRQKNQTTQQVRILLETAKAFLEVADKRLQER